MGTSTYMVSAPRYFRELPKTQESCTDNTCGTCQTCVELRALTQVPAAADLSKDLEPDLTRISTDALLKELKRRLIVDLPGV